MRAPLLALLLCTAAALPAAAHTRLERSSPADGDTLRAQPAELRLVFSQPVMARYTSLVLRGPDGAQLATAPLIGADDARSFTTPAPRLAAAGQYTIEWRTAAADGHVIEGSVRFVLEPTPAAADSASASSTAVGEAPPGAPPLAEATDRHAAHHADPAQLPAYLGAESAPNVLLRALFFAALVALVGLAAFRELVLPARSIPAEARLLLDPPLRRFGAAAAGLLLLVLPLRLWFQSAAVHGPAAALEPTLLRTFLLELPWGRAWLVQLAAAALAFAAGLAGRRTLLALAALPLAFTPAFQGHAAAVEAAPVLARLADGVHVLAAGAWVGALAVLLLAVMPALRPAAQPEHAAWLRALVHRFSPLALASVALLAASGAISGLLHIRTPADLYGTGYGRMLLLKLFFVALVLAVGWFNWRRARPGLETTGGGAVLQRTAALELLLAGAALAVTAALVGLPTP